MYISFLDHRKLVSQHIIFLQITAKILSPVLVTYAQIDAEFDAAAGYSTAC